MKRTLAILLSIAILCCGLPALAHGSQGDHDKDLKLALFGNADYVLRGEKRAAFKAIADAAALCIDQFSANESMQSKKGEFEDLSDRVHLSMSFADIDLNKNIAGENITPKTHRQYSHQGWSSAKYPNKEFWDVRKKILLEAAQQNLFDDSIPFLPWVSDIISSLTGPNEQCDAFCALVYYVHILGDHLEGDRPDKLEALEPLAQYESLSSPGIIPELQEYLQVLFADQKMTRTFMSLMQDLDTLGRKAEKVYYSPGGINTEEKCATNMKNAEELLKLLGAYVPELLKNEDFFTQIFPIS